MQRFAQYLPKGVWNRWSRASPLYPLEWKRPDTVVYGVLGVSVVLGILITYQLNFMPGRPGPAVFDDANIFSRVFIILYWPIVILQTAAHLLALNSPVRAVLSRLSPFWLLLIGARLFFIAVMMSDLSQFQGHYLDLLLSGTIPFGPPNVSPTTSVEIGIIIVSLTILAVLVMPITSLLFDASLGMFVDTLSDSRTVRIVSRVCLVIVRMAIILVALWVGAGALSFSRLNLGASPAYDAPNIIYSGAMWQYWGGAFLGISEGDQGLTLLHLSFAGRLWADIGYGVFVNIALVGYCVFQFWVAEFLLKKAIRRRTPPPERTPSLAPEPFPPTG